MRRLYLALTAAALAFSPTARAADVDTAWEVTPESEQALADGLAYLARTQGEAGNWGSNDLGLVALGVLAFMADGHMPGRGPYGDNVQRGLDYLIAKAKPSGLLNTAAAQRDMYNHGLATFVLTQAYGMSDDPRLGQTLDAALRLILDVQCGDGGWDYVAQRKATGHDLSLAVAQAKALRAADNCGLEVPPQNVELAIRYVRSVYKPTGEPDGRGEQYGSTDPLADRPGQFTYDGTKTTVAMAAAGAVCLQEFGRYDDFRIYRSLDAVTAAVRAERPQWAKPSESDAVPFDAYTLYYASQALYQAGGPRWRDAYPTLRDAVVRRQAKSGRNAGSWSAGRWVDGDDGRLFGTAAAVFTLAIPNRYLPILQRARGVESEEVDGDDTGAAARDEEQPER